MADTEVQGGFFTAGTVPNREFVLRFCKEKYGTEPEYLWMDEPTFAVLRHGDNKKWYALLMSVSRSKLGAECHTDEAADILVDQAGEAQLDPELTHASMQEIVDGNYWTTDDPTAVPGTVNLEAAQAYIDFLYENDTYTDADGSPLPSAPQAANLATNEYLG